MSGMLSRRSASTDDKREYLCASHAHADAVAGALCADVCESAECELERCDWEVAGGQRGQEMSKRAWEPLLF